MANQSIRANSRGWVWIAWILLIVSVIACGIGVYGSFALESAYSTYSKSKVLDSIGWAIENVDAYFLMAIISIIWIQVCATAKDTEAYLIAIERKLDRIPKPESDDMPEATENQRKESDAQTVPEYSGSPRVGSQAAKVDPHLE